MKTKKNVEAIERLAMKKDKEISDKLIEKLTKDFDADGDIIVGDEDELIMLRSGSPSDKEYNITVEKVLLDDEGAAEEYKILDQFSMKNNDKETMKKAIETYLGHARKLNTDGKYCDEYGGTVEYLEMFFSV